jgi:hypothetical protein
MQDEVAGSSKGNEAEVGKDVGSEWSSSSSARDQDDLQRTKTSEIEESTQLLKLVQRRMTAQNQVGLERTILSKLSTEIARFLTVKKDEVLAVERPTCTVKRYKALAIRETKLEKFLKYLESFEFGQRSFDEELET